MLKQFTTSKKLKIIYQLSVLILSLHLCLKCLNLYFPFFSKFFILHFINRPILIQQISWNVLHLFNAITHFTLLNLVTASLLQGRTNCEALHLPAQLSVFQITHHQTPCNPLLPETKLIERCFTPWYIELLRPTDNLDNPLNQWRLILRSCDGAS